MMHKILNTLIFLVFAFQIVAQTPRYHKVTARDGEGIYALMQRYHLNRHQCDFDQFYFLNKLTKKSQLKRGQSYYIPVFIYHYDGKSIRSTIKNDDWDKAVRIRDYNYKILTENLRRQTYEESVGWYAGITADMFG